MAAALISVRMSRDLVISRNCRFNRALRDDTEVLQLFREATVGKAGRSTKEIRACTHKRADSVRFRG